MPLPKSAWERIRSPVDEDPAEPEFPVLEPPNEADPLQKRIDELCKHFEAVFFQVKITGELLGRIQRAISQDVNCPVVVTLLPFGHRPHGLIGYALARPPPLIVLATPTKRPCTHCNGTGTFLMPTAVVDSGQSQCFRCRGTGSDPEPVSVEPNEENAEDVDPLLRLWGSL